MRKKEREVIKEQIKKLKHRKERLAYEFSGACVEINRQIADLRKELGKDNETIKGN